VVEHLVDAHGGTVSVDSAGEGHGATFRVTLERAASVEGGDRRAPMADAALPGVAVLVVEDDDAREIVRVLRDLSLDVRDCADAATALAVLESFRPALIVSDVGMGGSDGYELIRRIRASGRSADTMPAIALTAYGGDLDRVRAIEAGYQRHLVKPVRPIDRKKAVTELLHHVE
jgi:CheY-like chemotaxis protein